MDERGLNVGDVVRLKSGGPAMTVEAIDGPAVRVVWFDEKQQAHRESFPPETLALEGARPMRFR